MPEAYHPASLPFESFAGWQVWEEGEHYMPDWQTEDDDADPARTVLEMAVECIHKGYTCIDEQESQDQDLFLAHFEGKWEEEGEEARAIADG